MDYQNIRLAAIEMGGLSLKKMNKTYEMFFDETNNPRLFRITEEGFNIDDKAFFILGGLVFEKTKSPQRRLLMIYIKALTCKIMSKKLSSKTFSKKLKHF